MKSLASVLVLLGIAGLALNLVLLLGHLRQSSHVPFSYESYGGPGPLLGAILLTVIGLYLRGVAPER